MHNIALPGGSAVRLTITGRPATGLHRWYVQVREAEGDALRADYGSQIGGEDLHQRVDIPAQAMDCRIQIGSAHRNTHGWSDDHLSLRDVRAGEAKLGFCELMKTGSRLDDVLLSFVFAPPR